MQTTKSKFLKNVALNIAINGAFQRNSIYSANVVGTDKTLLRKQLRLELKKTLITILSAENYTDEDHYQTIVKFSKNFSKSYKKLLNNNQLNIGTTQKLINLYWKMLWLFDDKTSPLIHCPFDSFVIKEVKELKGLSWTKITKLTDYKKMVKSLQKHINGNQSIATWELDIYNVAMHEGSKVTL